MTPPFKQKLKAHEWMLMVAIDDEFRVTETMFAKDGSQYEVERRASLKERLDAAKNAASYFTPKLSSVEHNVQSNIQQMSDDELKAELEKAMQFLQGEQDESGKAKGQKAKAKGPNRARAVDQPAVQVADGGAEAKEAAPKEAN